MTKEMIVAKWQHERKRQGKDVMKKKSERNKATKRKTNIS